MKPIIFACSATIPKPPVAICNEIADLSRWSEFPGYGFLPSIEKAVYDTRTESMVGSRIRVHNSDGSTHTETITKWQVGESVVMKLHEFSPPLAHFADHFVEEWRFDPLPDGTTHVTRSFEMWPKRGVFRPILWLVSLIFRRAIDRHLALMSSQ